VHVRGLAARTAEHGDLDGARVVETPRGDHGANGGGKQGGRAESPKVRRSEGPKVRRSSTRWGYRAGSNGLRTVTPP
jgi:hypothetical protein